MGIRAEHLRQEYAGMDDAEIARAYALKSGYHVVVTYEDSGGFAFKGFKYDRELEEARKSPYISNVTVLYHDSHLENFDEADRKAAERARRVLGSNDRAAASTAAYKGNSGPDSRIEHNDRQCWVCEQKVENTTWDFFELTCFRCGATSIVHKTCVAPAVTPFDHFSGDAAFPMGCPRCNPEKSDIHFAKIRSSRVTTREQPAPAKEPTATQGIFRRLYQSLVARAPSTRENAAVTLPWNFITPANSGEEFFESIRPCLANILAGIASRTDPIVLLVDLDDVRWRGLLHLVMERPSAMYFSPEMVIGQPPQIEMVDGHPFYRAPVVNGQKVRVGIYGADRGQVVYALCGLRGIPPPFIKQIQAKSPPDRFTVVSFGPSAAGQTFLSVRHVSSDAKIAVRAPVSF